MEPGWCLGSLCTAAGRLLLGPPESSLLRAEQVLVSSASPHRASVLSPHNLSRESFWGKIAGYFIRKCVKISNSLSIVQSYIKILNLLSLRLCELDTKILAHFFLKLLIHLCHFLLYPTNVMYTYKIVKAKISSQCNHVITHNVTV